MIRKSFPSSFFQAGPKLNILEDQVLRVQLTSFTFIAFVSNLFMFVTKKIKC